MRWAEKLALIFVVVGCSQSAILSNETTFKTDYGTVFARPLNDGATWQAGPDVVGFSTHLTPELKAASIQAIEKASRCKVNRDSVIEQSALFVSATVNCGR